MVAVLHVEPLGGGSADPARLGGKAASLTRLVRLGRRVPPGFTITVDAFNESLARLGLSSSLEEFAGSLGDVAAASVAAGRIWRALSEGRIPAEVLDPVLEQVERLGLWNSNEDGLIVRSSATVEDSATHSFAGIFESLPITRPEELEPAIREVWRSAFSPRAVEYICEAGLKEAPSMAVVVQRFLEAERSGVMFTRFPDPGGTQRILVEHVEGGCEKLVKGEVTPERLWLDDGARVPPDLEGLLHPRHARELARLASDLEEVFGGPQDVEWCIYEGRVHLVQSRPITSSVLVAQAPGTDAALHGLTALLTGVAASPGVGSGPVHLAFNIEDALALERGQVLVTPMTNPDMVVAMRNSAAIVTDVGGVICHAAIVSRELGLPCVVGTETATTTMGAGDIVTVDGGGGAVYRGSQEIEVAAGRATVGWADLWSLWRDAAGALPGAVPIVSSARALPAAPDDLTAAVLVADLDLRTDVHGLWRDLEGMTDDDRRVILGGYAATLTGLVQARPGLTLFVRAGGGLPPIFVTEVVRLAGHGRVRSHADDQDAPAIRERDGRTEAGVAVPLATAARAGRTAVARPPLPPMDQAVEAAFDTIKFFGHTPAARSGPMPDPGRRGAWWELLPEYGRYLREFDTHEVRGDFEWLEVRPELVISPMLKSLVQPGFEMVPRAMGFHGLAPMYVKWIRCRYHFRSDTFARVWEAIVRATWDRSYMADLLARTRASYERLREVQCLFPPDDEGMAALSGEQMAALLTSWWPRWIEFFALCWFQQAQGDDIVYPFIQETVSDNLAGMADPPSGRAWPGAGEFVTPTTPVMSGEYMADVALLREALLGAGLTTRDQAEAALARGEHREVDERIAGHLSKWRWMRDRDLVFEPWDTPGRVIETALKTEPHSVVDYERNLDANLLGLSFHFDLSSSRGRAVGLNHAARFLHDLNVERENHHVLWLKYSYPVRRLCLEVERRLVAMGEMAPGDVFYLQAPELIAAANALPRGLPSDVAVRVSSRKAGFLKEARLPSTGDIDPADEDDYY